LGGSSETGDGADNPETENQVFNSNWRLLPMLSRLKNHPKYKTLNGPGEMVWSSAYPSQSSSAD